MESNETAIKQTGGYKKISPRWQKGESGNAAGRTPKIPNIEKYLRVALSTHTEAGVRRLDIITTNLINAGLNGDPVACAKVLDLLYGKTERIVPVSPQRA
jgi:Family of unknown function (DUF5681)